MKKVAIQTVIAKFGQPLKAVYCVACLYFIYWITLWRNDGFVAPLTVTLAMLALWIFMDSIDDPSFIALCGEAGERRHFLKRTDWLISLAISAVGGGLILGAAVSYVLKGLEINYTWCVPVSFAGGVLLALGIRALIIHLLFRRWSDQTQFYHENVKYPTLRARIVQAILFEVSLALVAILKLSNILGGVYSLSFGIFMLAWEFIGWIIAAVVLILAIHVTRLLVSRGKFLKRLKRMQEKGEIRYDYMGHPYLSALFSRVYFGLIITDYTDGAGKDKKPKVYRIAVVGTGKRRLVIACDHHTFQFKHEIRLRMSLQAAAIASSSNSTATGVTLATWYSTYGFTLPGDDDTEGEPMVIFDPVPYGIFVRPDMGKNDLHAIDNGSKVYGYTVWAKNSFANFLERT